MNQPISQLRSPGHLSSENLVVIVKTLRYTENIFAIANQIARISIKNLQ
ncbi:MAG: hypothetical protein V7L04_14345 [Nostoc sp.]|nr:hypothetical protein [Nostoc sp. S13]MDF5735832.1 hypothetical protein [Nostoc sp. S13]